MRLARCKTGLVIFSLALTAWAEPPETSPEVQIDAGTEAVSPAASECSFPGRLDPDGFENRRKPEAATRLFVASHPVPTGGVVPGDGAGQSEVEVQLRRVNFIDDEILGALDKAGVSPAPLSSDAEFLRRVTLDLTGRIPDTATVVKFLADPSPGKRDKLIDQLLASDAFVDRWAFFYDELFRSTFNAASGKLGLGGRNAFHAYFVNAIQTKKPWDVMAKELLTSLGNNAPGSNNVAVTPTTNFAVRNIQTNGPAQDTFDNLAASTGSAFLGVNIFCTSCHNGKGHTDSINLWLTSLGRSDFWAMAAFHSRVQMRRQDVAPNYYYQVTERNTGDYQLGTTTGNKTPRDGKYWAGGATMVTPKFALTGEVPQKSEGYREALARMVTTSPQFAKAQANYIWKELFGAGIVEPADDFDLLRQDPGNPPPGDWKIQPTHPRLMERLGESFASSGFDLRSLIRTMVRSSAYQLSSFYPGEWKEAYTPLFARHFVRRLRAEEIYDAISRATAIQPSLGVGGYTTPVLWAGQLPDVTEPTGSRSVRTFLDTFLRGDRDSNKRSSQGTVLQALTMMNDRTVTDRVKNSARGSLVNQTVTAKKNPEETVKALYLATLSRYPTPEELTMSAALFKNLKTGQTIASVTEDLQFSLMNKLDFLFNY